MRTNVGTGFSDGVCNIRRWFKCERTIKHREGQFSLLEQTQKSPETDTAPELEHTFASEVSAFERRSPISFRQLGFSEPLPSWMEASEPSSTLMTKLRAILAPFGHLGSGGFAPYPLNRGRIQQNP